MTKNLYGRLRHGLPCLPFIMFGNGKAPNPKRITVDITYKCNLKCEFCFLYSEKAEEYTQSWIKKHDELDFNEYKKIVKPNLVECGIERINFTGGEPFLKPNFSRILDLFSDFYIKVISNLSSLSLEGGDGDKILKNIDELVVSLDGVGKAHDKQRGVEGTFKKVEKNLESIAKNENKPFMRINSVLTRSNYENIFSLIEYTKEKVDRGEWSIDFFSIQLLDWQTPDTISKTEQFLRELGLEPFLQESGYNTKADNLNIEDIYKNLENIIQIGEELNSEFEIMPLFRPISRKEVELWFNRFEFPRYSRCIYPYLETRMDPFGNIYPCLKGKIGNLRNRRLEDIWNSKKYKKFRKKAVSGELPPECTKCCKLGAKPLKYIQHLPIIR